VLFKLRFAQKISAIEVLEVVVEAGDRTEAMEKALLDEHKRRLVLSREVLHAELTEDPVEIKQA